MKQPSPSDLESSKYTAGYQSSEDEKDDSMPLLTPKDN